MKIGIIGIGNVGSVIGKSWAASGHEIMFGVRDPSAEKVAGVLADAGKNASAGGVGEAAAFGEVVVLATPGGPPTQDAVKAAGDLSGKTVIDCTNPLAPELGGLTIGHTDSAGESVGRWAPGAKVVKALSTTGAANMADPAYPDGPASMFVCGDDDGAKKTVSALCSELGFDVVDCGPLESSRLLEPMALLWVSLAYKFGNGPGIAYRLMRR